MMDKFLGVFNVESKSIVLYEDFDVLDTSPAHPHVFIHILYHPQLHSYGEEVNISTYYAAIQF